MGRPARVALRDARPGSQTPCAALASSAELRCPLQCELACASPPAECQPRRISGRLTGLASAQLAFELSSAAPALTLSATGRVLPSSAARARVLAAIRNFGEAEAIQRSAPLKTVTYHLSQPAALLGISLGRAIDQSPLGARRFAAGAIAGALSKTATAPLEKLRMQLMTNGKALPWEIIRETWQDGGVSAFFAGNAADVLRVMPSKAIELMAFDVFKGVFHRPHERAGPLGTMLSGALAGLCSTTACFPLETIRTRMAVSQKGMYAGIGDCFRKTVTQQGFGALYQGVSASMVGAVPYSALRFGAYDGLKWMYRRRASGEEPLPPHVLVAAGALAGLAASTATFPLEVVRRRMMAGAGYSSIFVAMRTIVAEEGWQALYRGLGVSCIKQAPQTGITLWAYDTAKNLLKVPQSVTVKQ